MSKFSDDELKQRAFQRIAWVIKHFYDEQAEEFKTKGEIRLHSTVFEHLIFDEYINLGKSEAAVEQGGRPYKEHVVPYAYIRNLSFRLYQQGRTENEVANMVGRLLKIALITPDEASLINKKYKSNMPANWNWEKDSITRRLDDCGIRLIPRE